MTTQTSSPSTDMRIIEIADEMKKLMLSDDFISSAVKTAFEFEGVYDLLEMWSQEDDPKERNEIVADIQDMINDCAQKEKIESVYISFNDLEKISKDIRNFKDSLRLIVEKHGGISSLSKKTGIPGPSLSRFFNSHSMPRRVTLLKIANALGLSEIEIATEWSR